MSRQFALAFAIAAIVQAQEDPMDLLLRVRNTIAGTLDHLPRYIIGGVRTELLAAPEPVAGFRKSKDGALRRRVELGTLRGLETRSTQFLFRDGHSTAPVRAGLESSWVTVGPRPPASGAQ